jgi:uncharacterized membrane protein YfcA
MIRKSRTINSEKPESVNLLMITINGMIVGLVSGFVGAGGGFLIIPELVIFSKVPMKEAIGTSLVIITANSMVGFAGDLGKHNLDWNLLMSVTFATVIGIFVGTKVSSKIDGAKLKPVFGWFILVVGLVILMKVIFLK